MIRERLKTILLIFLVLTSLFLIRQFWIQSPYESLFAFNPNDIQSTNILLIDIIKPHRYLLNFDESKHTVFYSDLNNNLWNLAHSPIANVLSSNSIQTHLVPHDEFINYIDDRSIIYYFPVDINTYILARALDVSKPNDITEKIQTFDSIYIYLGKGRPYIVFSQGENHLKVYDSNLSMDSIKKKVLQIERERTYTRYYAIGNMLEVDTNLFFPRKMSIEIPKVYVKNQIDTDDIQDTRKFAEKFFNKQIDYIKEIVEDSGCLLYVYKDKVLKIYPNGLLEYFSPLEEKVTDRNLYLSLNTTLEFLSTYIDMPKDMYLSNIEEISSKESLGYRFTFDNRIKGLPIVLKDYEAEGFIQIDVFNEQVTSFKGFIRGVVNNTDNDMENDILSAYDIIVLNYDMLKEDYIKQNNIITEDMDDETFAEEVLLPIDEMSMAYLDLCNNIKKEKLILIWLFQIDDVVYGFDAYEGNLVFKIE